MVEERKPGSLLVRPDADETGFADSAGVRIAWYRYGSGSETILFIPTWNFVDSRVVRHQVDGLRDRFRVLIFDARGSGGSEHPASGYGFSEHADDALAVLDATGTDVASVVTASKGGHSAVILASREPRRVRRLVLVAPPMDVPGAIEVAEPAGSPEPDPARPDWRTDYATFVPWFIKAVFPEPGMETTIAEIVTIALGADHPMLLQQSAESDWDEAPRLLGTIQCPTLVIHGAADSTLPADSVAAVAAAIPRGELALLDGLGHRPDISRPAIVNPLVIDFLGGAPTHRSSPSGAG